MTDFNFAPQTAFEPIEITALQRTGLRNIKPREGTETLNLEWIESIQFEETIKKH